MFSIFRKYIFPILIFYHYLVAAVHQFFITRSCVPTSACTEMSLMIANYGFSTSCCDTDLYNLAILRQKVNFATFAVPLLTIL